MNTLHVIITRLAIDWTNHKNFTQNWDIWVGESIQFMDTLCRESLKNQNEQEFVLLSLVDEALTEFGTLLDNEIIISVKSDGGDYPKTNILDKLYVYFKSVSDDYDSIIVTRLDRDDCLRNDFTENVKAHFKDELINTYVDIKQSISYNLKSGVTNESSKYTSMVSPFVSTFEPIVNGTIQCYSMKYAHTDVGHYIDGEKINNLKAMQIITGKNMLNVMQGNPTITNKREYGLK